jgi:hypothetical protein
MAPFMGIRDATSAGTVFLGGTRPDFRAHLISLGLHYRL